MALIYKFTSPREAADLDVEVVNYETAEVTAVEDDPTDGPDGDLLYRVSLDEGDYFLRAKDTLGVAVFTANGVLGVPASIAAGGGGGVVLDGAGAYLEFAIDNPLNVTEAGVQLVFDSLPEGATTD